MSPREEELRRLLFARGAFADPIPARSGTLQLGALTAATTLLVYLFCLPGAATSGEGGELVAAASLGGAPPPPGYPLWSLAAGIFSRALPFGSPVWRVALFSALCASLACGLLTLWLRQQDVGRRAAVTAALLFGFGLSLWREAVLPGVQALTLLLLTALFVTVEQWLATRSRRWLLLTFCLLGLGGLHHGSFLAPAVIAAGIALMRRRAELRQKGCARTAASGALLGLLPILYLPLAVARTPYLCWGGPTHLPGVLPRLIGGIWWGGGGAADLPAEEVTGLLGVAVREHGWMGILLALLGALVLGRRFRGNLLVLLALLLANPLLAAGAGFLGVGQGPLARPLLFCLPSLLVLATLQAHGLDLVLQRYGNGRRSLSRVVTAATACLPLLLLATNARQDDYSRYRYGEDLGRSILASLPENGILITGGDWRTGLIHYCQGVRGDRPDVVLADPRGHLLWDLFPLLRKDPRHGSSLPAAQVVPDLLERGTRPIFSTEAGESGGGVRWEPYGLLFRALRDEESAGASVEAPVTEDPWARIAFGDLPSQPGGIARWLRDPPSSPPLDPPARRIAASYFEALLRRHRGGEAREAWSEVETLLAAFPR